MHRRCVLIRCFTLGAVLGGACELPAQTPNPLSSEVEWSYGSIKNNLLKLAEKMRAFEYDPAKSFRAWLKTVTRHAWLDSCSARPVAAAGGSQALEVLQTVEAREDLVRQLDDAFDREVLEEAVARVRARVTPKTWRVFELTAREGRSGAEAAEALGMTVAAVFVAKGRVQKLLQDEVRRLEGPEPA